MPTPSSERSIPLQRVASLRLWLGVGYGLLAVTLMGTVTFVVERVAAQRVEADVGMLLALSAQEVASRLDTGLQERLDDMHTLASLPLLDLRAQAPERLRAAFGQLGENFPEYAWIGLVDVDGTVLVSEPARSEGIDVSDRPWFAGALQGPYVGDLHEALVLGQLLPARGGGNGRFVDVAVPVHGADGTLQGVMAAHLSWAWSERLRREQRPAGLASTVDVFVIDADAVVLAGPEGWLGRRLPFPGLERRDGTLRGLFSGGWPDGADYLTGYAHTRGARNHQSLGWTVLVRQPLGQALAPLQELRHSVLLAVLPLLLLGVVAAFVLGRFIGAPLKRISDEARRIQSGQGDVELSDPGGYREARQLASSLRELLASLGRREADMRQLAETLEQRVRSRTSELNALNAQLETMALSDSLTGLANRRRFNEEFGIAVERAIAQGLPLSLVLLDVDHFKVVNDTHGHPAGDAVLRWLAGVCANEVRGSDLLARTGGEEFAVLAIDTPLDSARELAERLRRAVESRDPVMVGRAAIPITISLGVAGTENLDEAFLAMDPEIIASQLVSLADAALYRAKQRGRNRVQSA